MHSKMPKLGHTPYTQKKMLNLQLHPSPLVLCLEHIVDLLDPKLAQLLVNMSTRPSHCSRWGITHTHQFVHTHSKESFFHLNCLALWTIQSHSLGVNLIKISLACKYAITYESSRISKAPLPTTTKMES